MGLITKQVYCAALVCAALGCSVCRYDFTHPESPKSQAETQREMDDCYGSAAQGMTFSSASEEQHEAASRRWMKCMRERGYVVVKR